MTISSGKCPKCGNEDLTYGISKPQDMSIFYDVECKKCGFKGREWYELMKAFAGYTDENGNAVVEGYKHEV